MQKPTKEQLFAATRQLIEEAKAEDCKVFEYAAEPFCANCLCGWMEAAYRKLNSIDIDHPVSTYNLAEAYGLTLDEWSDVYSFVTSAPIPMAHFDKNVPAETRKEIFLTHLDILEATGLAAWDIAINTHVEGTL